MSAEIKIPVALWISRATNPNAGWTHLAQSNNNYQPAGFLYPDDTICDCYGATAAPIPPTVASTPNAQIQIHWVSSAASGNVKWVVYAADITEGVSLDPTTWDDSLSVIDATNGAYLENICAVSLSNTTVSSGRNIIVVLRRDARSGETQDTLAAAALVTRVLLVADQTT